MRKIEFTKDQIKEIILMYTHQHMGMASIGKRYKVSREAIQGVLRDNKIPLDKPGNKFIGGRKMANLRYISKPDIKERLIEYQKKWKLNNKESIKNYMIEYGARMREQTKKAAIIKLNHKTFSDLTFETLEHMLLEDITMGVEYKTNLLTKEYLKQTKELRGVEYLESKVDLLLDILYKVSPTLPTIETTETAFSVAKHISTLNFESIKNEDGDFVQTRASSVGNMYLKSLFKSFWASSYKNSPSPITCWPNKRYMRSVVKYRIGLNNSKEVFNFSLHQMVTGISAHRTTVSFFKPALAAAIYREYITVENPIVFDPCMGFGGRMLGFKALYPDGTYIGCEPNIETYNELKTLSKDFTNVKLNNIILEDYDNKEYYDIAFTSIPYFDLEKYSNGPEYDSFEFWKDTFIKKLLELPRIIINMDYDLCIKLGLESYIDKYLVNHTSHFNLSAKLKKEVILKINF